MIIQSLANYYDALVMRNEIDKLGWVKENVSFALNISNDGKLLNLIPLLEEVEQKNKMVKRPQRVTVPERVVRASGSRANFLCDNSSYFLGFDHKGKPERSIECFEKCKQLHYDILKGLKTPMASAIIRYFENWDPGCASEHQAVVPYIKELETANLVFLINGSYAHKDQEICNAWDEHSTNDIDIPKSICLVTGKLAPIEILHNKIKGIPGGQVAGTSLVSFNSKAFESYGKRDSQGLNSPVSKGVAFAYTAALNYLIADYDYRKQLGDTTIVYWGEKGDRETRAAFSLFAWPAKEDGDTYVKSIMSRLLRGLPVDNVDLTQKFYILGLSPNAARVSVRFFWEGKFGDLLKNVQQHYMDVEITKPDFFQQYPSPYAFVYETVNPNSKDKVSLPQLTGDFMRSILTGRPYPESLLQAVFRRIKADKDINPNRVAVIKAYLNRKNRIQKLEEGECLKVSLDRENRNTAYILGRLFAVLENIQQAANPGINVTIKDKYFNSACSIPGVVFPQLLKLSLAHIKKLQAEKRGLSVVLEKEKAELIEMLKVQGNFIFPANLSLNEQGLFIGGYYHQTQVRYEKKEEN